MHRDEAERLRTIVSLWLRRPAAKRTEDDLVAFYGELLESNPELIKHSPGRDSYVLLINDLRRFIR